MTITHSRQGKLTKMNRYGWLGIAFLILGVLRLLFGSGWLS